MTTPADTIRRAVLGLPYDPLKKPEKALLVQAFDEMQAELGANMSGAIVRDTLADLALITAADVAQMAWVVSDGTASNNGIYENAGTATATVWTRRADLPYDIIALTDAGAGSANAIVATSTLPLPSASGRALLTLNIFRNNTGAATLAVNGASARAVVTNSGTALASGYLQAGAVVMLLDDGVKYRLLSDVASASIQSAADASRVLAQAAATVATGAMSVFAATVFATKALATAYAPASAPDYIRLEGYTTAGDGGGALYKKVGSAPSHNGKFSITLSDAVTVVWYELSASEPNILMFGADATGVASSVSAINNSFGYSSRAVISGGTFLIDSDVTVAAGKTLDFRSGGMLTSATSKQLILNNQTNVVAGRIKIFTGNLLVTNVRVALPEWWGAVQSTSVSSRAAFDAAILALRNNGVLWLDQGFYAIEGTTPLDCTKGQQIVGEGQYQTTIRIITAATNFAKFTLVIGGKVSNLRISNNFATPVSGQLIDFQLNVAAKGNVEDIIVENCWNFLRFLGAVGTTINDMRLRNYKVSGVNNEGIRCENAENIFISDGICAGVGTNTAPMILWQDACQAILMVRSQFADTNVACLLVDNITGNISRGADARWNKVTDCIFDDSSTGADLKYLTSTVFLDCWFNSNGRSDRTAGYGIRLRKCFSVSFGHCQASNNGEHGIRLEAASRFIDIADCEIMGNNGNNSSSYGVWVEGGACDWRIHHCQIGNGAGWVGIQIGPVVVNTGASDRYSVTNNFMLAMTSNTVNDNGTGVNKDVTTGNYATAS